MSDLKPGEVNTTSYVDDLEGYQSVPSQNSVDNTQMRDAVGGNSLIALNLINKAAIDTIDVFHDVPSQNSADNVVMSDVIGNKTDTGYFKFKCRGQLLHG